MDIGERQTRRFIKFRMVSKLRRIYWLGEHIEQLPQRRMAKTIASNCYMRMKDQEDGES